MTIKSALSSLKKTFLPSESVSAERRKSTFGTESKAVAGGAIVATAAAALIAGPAAVGAAAVKVGKTVGTAVSKVAAAHPVATAATALIAVPALVSSKELRKDVTTGAAKTVGQLPKIGAGLGDAYSEFKAGDKEAAVQTLKETVLENKAGSIAIGAVVLGSSAAGLYYTGKTITDAFGNTVDNEKEYEDYMQGLVKEETKKETKTFDDKPLDTNPDVPTTTAPKDKTSSDVPITPQTQVIGKEAGVARKPHKYPTRMQSKGNSQSMRVNIFTNSRLVNTKYLKLNDY